MPNDFGKELRRFCLCIAICALLLSILGRRLLPIVRVALCLGALVIIYCCRRIIISAFRSLLHLTKPQIITVTEDTLERFESNIDQTEAPPATSTNESCLITDQEMLVFLRHYRKVDDIKTKVKGVTFRNDDGSSRQSILAHCHAGDQLRFSYYQFRGAHAYEVHSEWGQIGNLSADLADELAEFIIRNPHKCILLGEILNISGGYHGEYFGCNIVVTVYEKSL